MHHHMVRRLKRDVLRDLPPKRREALLMPLTAGEAGALSPHFEALDAVCKKIDGGSESTSLDFERKRLISTLFHETGNVKQRAVREVLKTVLPELGGKVILFAHHIAMLDTLQGLCEELDIGFIRIDGSTPQKERPRIVSEFKKPERRVAILSIGACGTGLNFTMCSHVIFTELNWNPGELLQAEDRTHRIGQMADSVFIQYLIAQGSLDDRVWSALNRKFATLNDIFNDNNADGFDCEMFEAKRRRV